FQRNLRCFAFAKLYFKVGDYEQARRHVTIYLNVKPESAEAQQLLGKILEKLGKYDAALEAYRTSLDLDPKQNKLVLKVCELLASDNVNFDQSGVRYFCEKAQSIDPNNPSIFLLKEKLILSEGKDPNDVAKLLLNEIEERPKDFNRRVRLLRHYLQNSQIKEAYDHVKNVNERVQQIAWYETAAEVLVKYQQDSLKKNLNWEFWMLLIGVLEKLVELSLDERSIQMKSNNGYVNHLFNFDQSLKIASESMQDCPDRNLVQEFLNHYRGQLCLHFITLVFKQAKQELIKYKEASQITLTLLFAAYHTQPADLQSLWITHASECNKSLVRRWNREASFRCSQSGHMLLSISKDRKSTVLEKGAQCSSGLWREQLLKRIFITRDHQSKIKTSYFHTCNQLVELVIRLPEANELIKYDDSAQLVHPDSLHHYIWIGLNRNLPSFKCTVFDGLPFSTKTLSNCSAESLNVLDIHAFIYCSVLCAQQQIEDQKYNIYYPSDKPNIVPTAVTNQLGTQNQAKFLLAAYKMFTNDYSYDFNEVRLTLIKGIEAIRCVGNHGLDVKVLVTLAKIFAERSKILEKPMETEQNDARAELYWKTALPLLDKLKNNQTLSYSPNRLFECKSKEMSLSEIQTYIDDGKLFNGIQFMKKKDYEKALLLFEGLKDPYASFYQAQICKMKAEEQTCRNKESVTSEMRSQNIILLSRARDCLYLTFDRLRDPSVDRRHPLNSQLGTEIDKIERMLSRIDPDTCLNRNECDGMSDENISLGSMGDHFNYTNYGNSSFLNGNLTPKNDNFNLNATPLRVDTSRREARPSPERLDAQLRQLLASKDTAVNHVLEQNKVMMDSQRALLDEIRGFKDAVNNLTATVDEMKGFKTTIDDIKELQKSVDELKGSVDDLKNVTDDVLKMKKEIAELKKDTMKIKSNQISDEDLYGLDEEYSSDYTAAINSNIAAGLTTNIYPTLGRLPQPNSLPYGPTLYHGMYPMLHYPALGLPQAGSLPYAPENQLADFRTLNALPQGLGPSPAYLQASFSQTGLAQGLTPGGLSQGLVHGGLPPTLLPAQGLPQSTLMQTNLGQSPHSNPLIPSTSVFSTLTSTNIPNQSVFATTTPHLAPSTNILTTTTPSFLSNNAMSSKAPPINVVITSSDPLPVTKSAPQPVLSVTIPPQHLKGGQKTQAHNYQIQMPASSTVTTPSVINQPPLAISTQNLLSNIPPPVYSSIEPQNKNVTLGVAIEKSLNQSFGNGSLKQDANKSNVSSTSIDEHDAYPDFKPIIPLPDEVPVSTGEENEVSLFEERAKLFRYVNKEWKERGIGVLKLLKDLNTGKVRLLMRREQVHKICANHFLTKDMILTQMANNDKAYIWAANDFADQEIVLEKLCARFKTTDAAQRFYKAFEDAKKNLSDLNESREKCDKSKEDIIKKDEQIAPKTSDSIPVTINPKRMSSRRTNKSLLRHQIPFLSL
ncbi:Anaphase-promoting complex subunit 3 protein, partial [Oryctes borbonicus]